MDLTTCYKILGLDPQADANKAKRAYKAQVRRWHPDQFLEGSSVKATAEEQLKQINIAYARVRAHLSLHRPDLIDPAAAPAPHSSAEAPSHDHDKTPPRSKPQRSWVDHLFDALNAFAGNRTDDSQPATTDHTDTRRKKSFEQVLDEMTGGINPAWKRPGPTTGKHARRHSTAGYHQYRQHGSSVGGVTASESKGPVKPVSRVRGIGKGR